MTSTAVPALRPWKWYARNTFVYETGMWFHRKVQPLWAVSVQLADHLGSKKAVHDAQGSRTANVNEERIDYINYTNSDRGFVGTQAGVSILGTNLTWTHLLPPIEHTFP